jgi:hypothetical protein
MIREAAVKMNRGAKVRRTTAQRTAPTGSSIGGSLKSLGKSIR